MNKGEIVINYKTMNVKMLEECDRKGGGYIGYKFLKSLFCAKHYEGINLETFNALFPNLLRVNISGLSLIDPRFVNNIIGFMKNNNKTRIQYFQLHTSKQSGISNV